MRDLLTYIGIGLIVLLTAALAAPLVLDVNAWRPRVAQEISAATGAQVALNGRIALRLLPTPRFSAENAEIRGASGALRAKSALLEIALPALLQGRLRFTRAAFDDAAIDIDADRALPAPARDMQIDSLRLRRARVSLLRGALAPISLDIDEFDASAPALAGPWRGQGALSRDGARSDFSFATEAFAGRRLPLKAVIAAPGDEGRFEFDGAADFSTSVSVEGLLRAHGKAAPGPWRAEAKLRGGPDRIEATDMSGQFGEGPLPETFSGEARLDPSGRLAVSLAATRLDSGWTDFFVSRFAATDARPVDLRLSAESLAWRGADWSQVKVSHRPNRPVLVSAQGPGAARVDLSLRPEAAGWRGRGAIAIGDFGSFVQALPDARALAGARLHSVALDGDVLLSPQRLAFENGALTFDGAKFAGDAAFTPGAEAQRPKFVARLTASGLDVDETPDFGSALPGGADLDLTLDAQTVHVARHGEALAQSGRVVAHFLRDGGLSRLERLEIRDAAGADLSAQAQWRGELATLKGEARLKATDMTGLARIFAKLVAVAPAQNLAARARLFSPADLVARADKGLVIDGVLGATKIAVAVAPDAQGAPSATLDLSAPEASVLLEQFGAPLLLARKLGVAHVGATLRGQDGAAGAFATEAKAELAGLRGGFSGRVAQLGAAPDVAGKLDLDGDPAGLLASFGLDAPAAPLRLSADMSWRDGALRWDGIAGDWNGGFSGALAFGAQGLSGALRCARLSAPALLALVLGPPAPKTPQALWPSLSFAPMLFEPPPAQIALRVDDLQPFGGKAHFDLALGPGVLSVKSGEMAALGGILQGSFDLRRAAAQATVSGEARAMRLKLANPAFSGDIDGKLSFAGHGDSVAALLGSLAGGGEAQADALTIAGAALDAPDRALAASQSAQVVSAPFDAAATAKTLDAAFARDSARALAARFSARLADGRLTLSPIEAREPNVHFTGDLRDGAMSLSLQVEAGKRPDGWTSALPGAGVVWEGPWAAPQRRVKAEDFVNAVAQRALEREQARIEAIRARDRERARRPN